MRTLRTALYNIYELRSYIKFLIIHPSITFYPAQILKANTEMTPLPGIRLYLRIIYTYV